jgi:hypothetical protein
MRAGPYAGLVLPFAGSSRDPICRVVPPEGRIERPARRVPRMTASIDVSPAPRRRVTAPDAGLVLAGDHERVFPKRPLQSRQRQCRRLPRSVTVVGCFDGAGAFYSARVRSWPTRDILGRAWCSSGPLGVTDWGARCHCRAGPEPDLTEILRAGNTISRDYFISKGRR